MKTPKFVTYRDSSGEYRWRFVAGNGKIVADCGEGYLSKRARDRAIVILRIWAEGAPVVKA